MPPPPTEYPVQLMIELPVVVMVSTVCAPFIVGADAHPVTQDAPVGKVVAACATEAKLRHVVASNARRNRDEKEACVPKEACVRILCPTKI